MARAMWGGSISFGLVNIPVEVYGAVTDKDIRFHQFCKKHKSRIHQKLVCEANEDEIAREDVLKGYEIARDQYVIFEKGEIEKLQPEKDPNIEIMNFIDMAEIDPIYFEKPYYLLPKHGAAKSYGLLLEAMKASGRIAVGHFVMRGKEYLGALRPLDNVICLEIMRFADEVISADQLEIEAEKKTKPNKTEVAMAKQLIDTLYAKFKPERYKNEYRQRVQAAIEAKAKGQEVVTAAETRPEGGKVVDLMSALKKSLNQAKQGKTRKSA